MFLQPMTACHSCLHVWCKWQTVRCEFMHVFMLCCSLLKWRWCVSCSFLNSKCPLGYLVLKGNSTDHMYFEKNYCTWVITTRKNRCYFTNHIFKWLFDPPANLPAQDSRQQITAFKTTGLEHSTTSPRSRWRRLERERGRGRGNAYTERDWLERGYMTKDA